MARVPRAVILALAALVTAPLGFVPLGVAPLMAAPASRSCTQEIGRRDAAALVDQCRQVSPATRPPCNAANACSLIREEIERGCIILGGDAPEFCATTEDDDEEDG